MYQSIPDSNTKIYKMPICVDAVQECDPSSAFGSSGQAQGTIKVALKLGN
jgi:hypothetical protein